jgi:hypothetical protein
VRIRAPRAVAELLVSAVPELRDRLAEYKLRHAWSAVVGPDVARRSRPATLVSGCLTVVVDNSPWLQEVTLRAAELTARLRERFPEVRSLRFVLGRLEPFEPPAAGPERAQAVVPLAAADRRTIDAAAAAIPDETLAAAARSLLTKAWRSPRARGAAR